MAESWLGDVWTELWERWDNWTDGGGSGTTLVRKRSISIEVTHTVIFLGIGDAKYCSCWSVM